ncbi:MAG: enoyl-CoA hydratase [Oceanicoccus sp.]
MSTQKAEQLVTCEVADNIAVLTLNRPEVMNALNAALRQQLVDALLTITCNREIRVIILTGNGRAFCAGLDLAELKISGELVKEQGIIGREMLVAFDALNCPVIAAVNGYAMTGGLELALLCDVIIASENAVFADTHARFGIVPAWGVTQRLPRMIGPLRAKEMSLTGNKIDAQTAYQWGLVNRVVAPEQLMEQAVSLAQDMVACDEGAQTAIKTLIDIGWQSAIEAGLEMEKAASVEVFRHYSEKQKTDNG